MPISHLASRRLWPILVLASLLTACAVQPPLPEGELEQRWRNHRDRITDLNRWGLKGRIALRLGDEGWTATLHWQQQKAAYLIRLIAPLGSGVYDLRGDARSVQLRMPDDRLLYADDAETLLQQNLGWEMPVEGLVWWVRGVPSPAGKPQSLSLDKRGRLQALQQQGWNIHYDRYGLYSGGVALPEKLTIERENVRLRLLIHTWEV